MLRRKQGADYPRLYILVQAVTEWRVEDWGYVLLLTTEDVDRGERLAPYLSVGG